MKKIRSDVPAPDLDAEWLTTEGYKRKVPKPETNFIPISRLQQRQMDSFFAPANKNAGKLSDNAAYMVDAEIPLYHPLNEFITGPKKPPKARYVTATYTPSSFKEMNKTEAPLKPKTYATKASMPSATYTPSSSTKTYKTLGKGKLSLNFKQGIPITTYTPSTSADTQSPKDTNATTTADIYSLNIKPGSTRTYKTLGKGRMNMNLQQSTLATAVDTVAKGEFDDDIASLIKMPNTAVGKNETLKASEKKRAKSSSKFSMDDDDVSVELELDAFDINNISDDEILEGLNFTIPEEDSSLINCVLFSNFGSQDSSDLPDLDLFADM